MPNELKPCPFCGSKVVLQTTSTGYSGGEYQAVFEVGCKKCNFAFKQTSFFKLENGYPKVVQDGYASVIEKWNRRVDDVVEVVRCNDCYYYSENKGICTNTACVKSFYGCKVNPDDFCSYGERKCNDG